MRKNRFPLLLAFAGLLSLILAITYLAHSDIRRWVNPWLLAGQCVLIAAAFIFSNIPRFRDNARLSSYDFRFPFDLLITVILFIELVLLNRFAILRFFNSADEHSCWFLAECLRQGKLFTAAPPLREFFSTPHIGDIAGKWFSVYPPGWPLLWAAGLQLGMGDWINPLLLSGAFYFIFAEAKKIYSSSAIRWAQVICMLSPFFLLTGASYFSHNTCLFFLSLFLASCLRWREDGRRRWAALAGFSIGYALLTRYLTAAAFAAPLLLYVFQKKTARGQRQRWLIFFSILIFTQFFHLAYNAAITGNPLNPPNHFLHSHEKLGFIAGYTPLTALEYLAQRILYLMDWAPPVLIPVFLISLCQPKRNPLRKVISACVLSVPLAYTLYYSWGGNQFGPRYYFEIYPWLVLEAAAVLFPDDGVELSSKSEPLRRALSVLILLAAPAVLIPQTLWVKRISFERKAFYDQVAESVQKPALVFIQGFIGSTLVMSQEDAVRNPPLLNSEILYAADQGAEKNESLQKRFPGRFSYQASFDRNTLKTNLKPSPAPH